MRHTTKYVGPDVHQATTVSAVREASGRMIARTVLPTDAPALRELVRGMRGAIHVTFEEGTQAQWPHDLLVPVVDRVLVCNQRGETPQGNKDDHVDAVQLSELLRLKALFRARGIKTPGRTVYRTPIRRCPW
jgi:transposase